MILKYGVRAHSLMDADNIFKTCCALHNMLLEVDGLAAGWEIGVQFHWETELDDSQDLPFALRRFIKPSTARNLDTSGNGIENDIANSTDSVTTSNTDITKRNCDNYYSSEANKNVPVSIKDMCFQLFCKKLISHFNILFHKKEVKWPHRLKENKDNEDS